MPLLGIAMVTAERKQLASVFKSFRSASLFGNYGAGHETGVDVRDLSRYAAGSFSGVFGILLFDYFEQHEQALAECFRVIAPGGIFFTHIGSYRLLDGDVPPKLDRVIKPREGYFEYVPKAEGLPSVKVGREWFIKAMGRAGFATMNYIVEDKASQMRLDWFVGVKPDGAAATPGDAGRPLVARKGSLTKTYTVPVDPHFGFKRITVELSVPDLPEPATGACFAEHVYDRPKNCATDMVIACKAGGVAVSNDLGVSWDYVPTPKAGKARLWNSFTLADGTHLLQVRPPSRPPTSGVVDAPIYRFDRDWRFLDRSVPGFNQWHGTNSIDEAGGTIIFGEYPANLAAHRGETDLAKLQLYEKQGVVAPSRLFRSRDRGRSWQQVFEQPWREVRHFHTVVADPYLGGRWWASSGDRPSECRVWCSTDDGSTWRDVTDPNPDVALHPQYEASFRRSVHRHTAIVVQSDRLLWGVDDWLGSAKDYFDANVPPERRVGARLCISPKSEPLRTSSIGFVGNPVRSIVDIGEAYIVMTEAKRIEVGLNPQVLLCSKKEPFLVRQLFTIDNLAGRQTGFTYSRASMAAKDGVFFSYRPEKDAFESGAGILRWRVSLD
jgi:hypothetical protein